MLSLPLLRAQQIPGIPIDNGLPVIGHAIQFHKDILTAIRRLARRHGPVFQSRTGPMNVVTLLGPDAVEYVFRNRDGHFSSQLGWSFFLDRVFPNNIMMMDGHEHRYQRRIMQSAFTKAALASYVARMHPAIEMHIDRWVYDSSDRFEIYPALKQLTLDLATTIFMGTELGPKASVVNRAFVDMVEASISMIRRPVPGSQMWRGVRGRKLLVDVFRSMLPEKRSNRSADFFSQFCHARSEDGDRFTDQEIIDHMIFLMMAAHDTTTSTLSTLFFVLAEHPNWQERLRKDSIALGDTRPDLDGLAALKRHGLVMREALRMYPPLTSMPRGVAKDIEFAGHWLPAGTFVGLYPIHTHYMESIWTAPFRFDPSRFGPERNEHKRHPFAYTPFGGGAHVCIGQHFADHQIRAIMHHVLPRLRWSLPPGYQPDYQMMPIAKPRDGLPVRIQRL